MMPLGDVAPNVGARMLPTVHLVLPHPRCSRCLPLHGGERSLYRRLMLVHQRATVGSAAVAGMRRA